MPMKRLDIAAALILLALSGLVAAGTSHLPYWSDFAPGPAFASMWVAGTVALIAVLLLARALRAEPEPADWPDRDGAGRVLLTLAALWLLAALLPWLGFVAAATLFLLAMLLVVQRRRLGPSLLATFITVAGAQAIFGLWLQIDLPKGPLGF
jgi:putative tricarboxylic transport membrane protein